MDNVFLFKLSLSFLIGGVWIVLATVLAEKFGTKIGGLITGLPSTLLFGLFFIGWSQSPQTAIEATTIVPIVGGINCLFILTYIYLAKKNFWLSIFSALLVWSILSSELILMDFNNWPVSLMAYLVIMVISFLIVEKKLHIQSESGPAVKYTFGKILFRGTLGGLIIALAVLMGKIGGALLGGMFSMFPAMFLGALLINYFSHGAQFSSAVLKVSILSAISVVIHGIAVRYTYLPLGLWSGTLVAIVISFSSGFLIYQLVIKKVA